MVKPLEEDHMGEPHQDRNDWVRIFHPAPDATRQLVCFPHAGGAASYYHALSAALSPGTEVLVVQYPGRENRLFDEPIEAMDALADAAHRALRPELAGRPVLFGHSMGAIVAFEVARRMEQADGPGPGLLVVSACPAPSRRVDTGVRLLGDDAILAEIMGLGGTDQGVGGHPELARLIMPAIRADLHAIETYRAEADATVHCPISVFVPDSDPKVTFAAAESWRMHTTAGVDLQVFVGGHFYLGARPDEFLDRLLGVLA
ncbi:thioesterase II family protein [Streptomyces sp. NPDC004629]|uniref:thioesterase II family protein n=1 Tax=Streptomyces sp. NPDC004629 TaxID=3364705 RepID=UPI0036B777B3